MSQQSKSISATTAVTVCLLLLCPFIAKAQAKGSLELNQSKGIGDLIGKHIEILKSDNTIDGYRIQIFMEAGNNAIAHADSVMSVFNDAFPETPAYISFGQPYYRIRVGDFRTRLDAERTLEKIKRKYPNSFVTADRIVPPPIKMTIPLEEL